MLAAVVMVGAESLDSLPVRWVQGARRAATRDLLAQLRRQPLLEKVILVSPERGELLEEGDSYFYQTPAGSIHVGETLARLVTEFGISRLLYFGGGAVPLLSDAQFTIITQRLAAAEKLVITNNQFASDWAGVAPAGLLTEWVERLPRDNMLGWVLSTEAGLPVETLAASAATRLDIDTPSELLVLRLHPQTQPHLRQYLEALPLDNGRLEQALAALARPASRIFIAGRFSPEVWLAVNRVSRAWLRVVSEERGMISSGRQARGEVRSLLADYIDVVGLRAFFATLSDWADAAFIDTRVTLAHYNRWPSATERFASDLGLRALIQDEWLGAFTEAALACPIPVVLGGHGLLAGDMLACCEILAGRTTT